MYLADDPNRETLSRIRLEILHRRMMSETEVASWNVVELAAELASSFGRFKSAKCLWYHGIDDADLPFFESRDLFFFIFSTDENME